MPPAFILSQDQTLNKDDIPRASGKPNSVTHLGMTDKLSKSLERDNRICDSDRLLSHWISLSAYFTYSSEHYLLPLTNGATNPSAHIHIAAFRIHGNKPKRHIGSANIPKRKNAKAQIMLMKKAETAMITNTWTSFISTLLPTKETTNPIASTRVLLFLLRRKEDLKISRLTWIDRKKLQCV